MLPLFSCWPKYSFSGKFGEHFQKRPPFLVLDYKLQILVVLVAFLITLQDFFLDVHNIIRKLLERTFLSRKLLETNF